MDKPLIITNMHNLSLESYCDEQPQLVADFTCKTEVYTCLYIELLFFNSFQDLVICCATIRLYNVSFFTVKRLNITLETPHVAGLVLQKVVNATIELVEVYPTSKAIIFLRSLCGIVSVNSHYIQMHLFVTRHWWCGLGFYNSNNIHIYNATASNNAGFGIYAHNSTNFTLSSSYFRNNLLKGIFITLGYNIAISNTTSIYNSYGIYSSMSNKLKIINCNASNNTVVGMSLSITKYIHLNNTNLSHNGKYGLEILSSQIVNIDDITATENVLNGIQLLNTKCAYITKFTTLNNFKNRPSSSNAQILIDTSQLIYISDSYITVNTSVASSGELITQPAVVAVYHSDLNLSRCIFTGSRISAIKAIASNITLSGNLTFSNNRAFTGTAFILLDDSRLIVEKSCRVHFINNRAINTGGVFTISSTQKIITQRNCSQLTTKLSPTYNCQIVTSSCFLRTKTYNISTQHFIFANNSAGKGGDIVYGGYIAYGFIRKKNCMDTFDDISNISETSLSLISSDPLRVCLCNQRGIPDCMLLVDPTPHFIYSGQTISISAVVVGQNWGTVAGSVYAQLLHKSTVENKIPLISSQVVQNTNQHSCNSLHYTIFSKNEDLQQVFVLTAQDIYVPDFQYDYILTLDALKKIYLASQTVAKTLYYRTNPVYINISLLPCPPGFHIRSSEPYKCNCNKLLQQIPGVECFIQDQTIERSGLVWVGKIENNGSVYSSLSILSSELLQYNSY